MDSQKELVIKDFDRKSGEYSEKYKGRSSAAHSFMTRRQRVYEQLEEVKYGKILDIGCGPGVMVDRLTREGHEVFGVDISNDMIRRCRERFGHRKDCHFSVGNVEELNFPEAYFDAVICMGLVEYIDSDEAAINQIKRVLKPGGILIVTLPNGSSPYRLWAKVALNKRFLDFIKKSVLRKDMPTLIHREYKEKSYTRLLAGHGLSVLDVVYYNFNLFFFPIDRLIPGLAVSAARRLEKLSRSKLRWLGTGFIVKARKL